MHRNVLVAGRLILDFIVDLNSFPQRGASVVARSLRPEAGGKGLNIAAALARLGLRPFLLAKVGGDEVGKALLAIVEREGINSECVLVDAEGSSGLIVGLVDCSTSEEAHIIANPEASILAESHVDDLRGVFSHISAAIVTPGISIKAAMRVVELCAQQNVPPVVVFHFRPHEFLTPEQLDTLSRCVDYLFGTVANLRYLLSLRNPNERDTDALGVASKVRTTYGFRAVCATDGALGGAYADSKGDTLQFVPFPSVDHPLDRTGAVDAFTAGFVVRILETGDVHESIRFASAAGRLATLNAGGYPAMPLRNSVIRYLDLPTNRTFDLFGQPFPHRGGGHKK